MILFCGREVYTSNSKKIGTDGMYVSIWDQEWTVKSKKEYVVSTN
jgi:hypothetical protein